MSLAAFLDELTTTGRARLTGAEPPTPEEVGAAAPLLAALDARARLEEPAPVPGYRADVAAWAARILYRACQALTFREIDAEVVRADLAAACPGARDAGAAHAADLTLRHLPELLRLARGLPPDDVLVAGLRALARAWPLSSVGVRGVAVGELAGPGLEAVVGHPGLLRRYRDRVLAAGDLARLGDPRVAEAVREALGAFPELAPAAAAAVGLTGEEAIG